MGQRVGAAIGAVGGLIFLLVNAGALPPAVATGVRVVGVALFAVVLWYAVLRTRGDGSTPRPPARAFRTYWACVVAEVLAIPLGAQLLVRVLHRPELTPVWVVFVVGVHFLPFARAFRVPLFGWLGAVLVTVAVVGGVATLRAGAPAAGLTGVLAGLVLLGFAGQTARTEDRRRHSG